MICIESFLKQEPSRLIVEALENSRLYGIPYDALQELADENKEKMCIRDRNPDRTGVFYLLQIRPMVDNKMMLDEDLTEIPDEKTLIRSHNAIGQGVSNEVYDVVYVKTDDYSAYNNPAIADEIDRINRRFLEEGRNYVLVGPGRWGSSDPWFCLLYTSGTSRERERYLQPVCGTLRGG